MLKKITKPKWYINMKINLKIKDNLRMKKRIITDILLAAMVLTGCGSKGFTGEKSAEAASEFRGTTVDTVEFKDGKPVSVNIDVKNDDGTMKPEASISGDYDMKNEPGKKWNEQIDLVEEFIVDNDFDLSKINLVNEAGNTDAISGASVKVGA